MRWLIKLLTRSGDILIARFSPMARMLSFGGIALAGIFSPRLYNSATRTVVEKQIYFTAWQILGSFSLFAALLSLILIQIAVTAARNYGLGDLALEVVLRFLVIELLPLVTALFVALRSGAAINAEIALMNINNEIQALADVGVDALRLEFLPRVIGGVLSVLALTAVVSLIAMLIAYVSLYGLETSGLAAFSQILGQVFSPLQVLGLWLKCLMFGLAVTVIPIAAGLEAPHKLFFAPIAVHTGMVRLFFALMLIEVGSLAITYL
ncbi:MAG: ABC transporter permease [Hydrogenophilaceae bacterium]|nr:ABC transporter permease [Hydrogenophilaceae bacterium]